MAASTPIYDQFARPNPSLRSSQHFQHSHPASPSKHSIALVASAPIESPKAQDLHHTGRQRPQSQIFGRDRPFSQRLDASDADSKRISDLKHSRSQSHALFPLKRKEIKKDIVNTPKRSQSVLERRDIDSGVSNSALVGSASGTTACTSKHPVAPSETAAFSKKFVVVGDGGSGKTCLLMRYKERTFPDTYVPTVFENYITHKHHRGTGKTCEVALWDTAGQEEYDRLRPLSYPETDVLLVCFAIDCPQSLDSVKEKWYPEVLHFCPTTPLILVGCKSDLRDSDKARDQLEGQGLHMLTVQQGVNIANYIGAEAYMECSSKEMVNVDEVFELSMDISVGTETCTDWRMTSFVGGMLSRGELGGASQLGRKKDDVSGRTETTGLATHGNNTGSGIGFVGKGKKSTKKTRRACRIL